MKPVPDWLAEQYGLHDDDPFVVITLVAEGRQFQLEYWPQSGGRPLEKQLCIAADVSLHLDRMLKRLWDDSRGRRTA